MEQELLKALLSNDGLVNKAYDDAVKNPISTISSAVNNVLKFVSLPFTFLGLTADELTLKYRDFISDALKKTPPEKLAKPKALIISPLLENVKYIFEEDDLREMYANLLSCAMNSDVTSLVHPAFVEVLKQMSPLDAKLFKDLFVDTDSTYLESFEWTFDNSFKLLSIDSLERLGLIFQSIVNETLQTQIKLTNFGCIFYQLCIEDNSSITDDELMLAIKARSDYYPFDVNGEKLSFSARMINTISELNVYDYSKDLPTTQEQLPALIFCVQNNDRSQISIDELYIEIEAKVGRKKIAHKILDTKTFFPYNLNALSYKNFIFTTISDENIIKSMKKGKANVIVVTGTISYDFNLSEIF